MNSIIEFFMDPLRLTLIIAGVVVLLAIIVFSRKSNRQRDFIHSSPSSKEFSFGSQINTNHPIGSVSDALSSEMLTDEEVIVLPRRKTESELSRESAAKTQDPVFSAPLNDEPKNSVLDNASFKQDSLDEKIDVVEEKYVFTPLDDKQAENKASVTNTEKTRLKMFDAVQKTSNQGLRQDSNSASRSQSTFAAQQKAADVNQAEEMKIVKERTVIDDVIDRVSKPQVQQAQLKSGVKIPEKTTAPKQVIAKEKPIDQKKVVAKTSTHKSEQNREKTPEIKPKQKPATAQARVKEKYIVLHILANDMDTFNGLDILDATKTLGLAFGKHAIFHYPMSAAPAGDSKFCLVNMSSSGNFETNQISSLETKGISLIMSLPIRGADSLIVFSNMVGVAQALARKLGGEILDQTRKPLTPETVDNLRADIEYFENVMKQSKGAESIAEA